MNETKNSTKILNNFFLLLLENDIVSQTVKALEKNKTVRVTHFNPSARDV